MPSVSDSLRIKYELIRDLRMAPSEIQRLPVTERNYYHRTIREEIEEWNRTHPPPPGSK